MAPRKVNLQPPASAPIRASSSLATWAITTMAASSLLLVAFLDRPYRGQPGSIRPTAMRESVASILHESRYMHPGATVRCDRRGRLAGALERGEFAEL